MTKWGNEARQAGCAYLWDDVTKQMAILPDPLGGASLFCHRLDGIAVWSTDYRELIRVLRSIGGRPQKSADYQIERMILGNGGFTPTSYEGGERIPVMHGVIIDGTGPRLVRYGSADALTENRSYITSAGHLREDVLESMSAIGAASVTHKICHLTGGLDTRLVLGASLASGAHKALDYFCSGPPGVPDRVVADGLSSAYGLTRTRSGGLTPISLGPHTQQRVALLEYAAGLSTVGPTGLESPVPVMVVAGGYGELMRPFHRPLLDLQSEAWSDDAALLRTLAGRSNLEELLSAESLERLAARAASTIRDIRDTGVPEDFVPSALYISVRNRYHVGAKALWWSRVGTQVNPLYSVHAVAASRAVSPLAREANVVMFDLLNSFDPDLLRYPFDKPRLSNEYLRQRRTPSPLLPFPHAAMRFTAAPVSPPPTQWIARPLSNEVRRTHVARANSLGLPFWQSVHLEDSQADLRHLLTESVDEIGHLFKVEYLRELATTRQWNRQRVRQLYAAVSIAQWWVQPDGDE